jgi:hypothetical protein
VLEWERTLEVLRRQGWGYGFGKCPDTETGSPIFLVNLSRGGKRLSIFKPSLEEAVRAINRLAQEEVHLEKLLVASSQLPVKTNRDEI